jgi:hypothetical protein
MPKQQRLPSSVAPGVPAAQRWFSMEQVQPWHSVASGTVAAQGSAVAGAAAAGVLSPSSPSPEGWITG